MASAEHVPQRASHQEDGNKKDRAKAQPQHRQLIGKSHGVLFAFLLPHTELDYRHRPLVAEANYQNGYEIFEF